MSRIEEIQEHRQRIQDHEDKRGESLFAVSGPRYVKDTGVLLERVGELEAENEALHTALKASGERREQLERENEKLKREVEGLHAMIQQAIHPQSE